MNTIKNALDKLQDIHYKISVRESSKLAHEAIKPSKEKHYKEIERALRSIGKPSTGKTIAEHSYLDYHAIMKRVSEMRDKENTLYEYGKSEEKFKPILWDLVENKV